MHTTDAPSNGRTETEHLFPDIYLPATPSATLIEFGRRVVAALDQTR